uniref:Uncharacterized protein n=1 Tax=Sphaerodactylus townsendi TaxID=933632 RepID=A0ACB8G8V2_9SAUR
MGRGTSLRNEHEHQPLTPGKEQRAEPRSPALPRRTSRDWLEGSRGRVYRLGTMNGDERGVAGNRIWQEKQEP